MINTRSNEIDNNTNKMKILLIDIDSKIPNLALMKLSTYHKARGDTVKLQVIGDYTTNIYSHIIPDKIYASVIFKKNKFKTDGIRFAFPDVKPENIIIGGSGYDLHSQLPLEVDCLKPDYDLYPNCDSSYGYTSRGCNRNCYFCIVPTKEGKFKRYMEPSVFYDKRFDKIFFLDNNILWDKAWFRHVMQFCIDHKLKPWFNQGLDVRLIDESDMKLLMKIKRDEMFQFAWDDVKLEHIVRQKVKMMQDVGMNTRSYVQFYVYIDSDEQFESGLYRCNELKKMRVNPYVMYNIDNPTTQRIQDILHWANQKMLLWKSSFEDYQKIRHHRNTAREKGQSDIESAWA